MSASSSARDVYSPALMNAVLPCASTNTVIGKYFARLELLRDLLVGVLVGGIRKRALAQELLGGGPLVLRVDAEEGDLLAALGRDLLEDRELGSARPAPGRPLVDHGGVALELVDPAVEGLGAAVERWRSTARAARRAERARRRARAWPARGRRRWSPAARSSAAGLGQPDHHDGDQGEGSQHDEERGASRQVRYRQLARTDSRSHRVCFNRSCSAGTTAVRAGEQRSEPLSPDVPRCTRDRVGVDRGLPHVLHACHG